MFSIPFLAMMYIQTSLLKIDTQDHINRIQDLEKENQELRKKLDVLNVRHIDHMQDKEKEKVTAGR